MSTLKPLKLKGYTIIPSKEGLPLYAYSKEQLDALCDIEDRGAKHSWSSRFVYRTSICSEYKERKFGTALGALQAAIMKAWKVEPNFLVLIEKVDS